MMAGANKDTVSLQNEDAENTLVGSMLMSPELLQVYGAQIQEEWFSSSAARIYFAAAMKSQDNGGQVSAAAVLGNLPDSANGQDKMTLKKLYMGLCDAAVVPDQFMGVLNVVRDRWARRKLSQVSKFVDSTVTDFTTDPFELSCSVAEEVGSVSAVQSTRDVSYIDASADKVLDSLARGEKINGVTTGMPILDKMLNGYKSGQFYVIAARPAMGKSAFGLSSLLRTAMAGHGVVFFSMEMTEEEITARTLADLCGDFLAPSYGDIMRGKIPQHFYEKFVDTKKTLNDLPFCVDFSPTLTAAEIVARARQYKAELEQKGSRLDVICIDHLTEVAPSNRYKGNPVMEVSENTKRFRVLAKELDCCVVALCQLSREVEKRNDKKPQLSDLRWTGEIEQAAHVVAFLYREEYYLKNDSGADAYLLQESKNVMEFLVRKNRQGVTGDVRLFCDMAHSSVREKS